MYKFILNKVEKAHQYEELIKVFLKPEEFIIALETPDENCSNTVSFGASMDFSCEGTTLETTFDGDKDKVKKEIYLFLKEKTGKIPPWGIITGIRPVKLFGEIAKIEGVDKTKEIFLDKYCVSSEKANLAADIYQYQQSEIGESERNALGVYIGIPFCPTRCLYCSFTSNQVKDSEMERYVDALIYEIEESAKYMRKHNIYAETIYIGGGTPTTLSEEQLGRLLDVVNKQLLAEKTREFTVEAGRPDTITEGKLRVIKEKGAKRISINPQTMRDETLKTIGRNHSSLDIEEAFNLAKKVGTESVNCDLIAGLPGEDLEDFRYSLLKILEKAPENITVHTLAVKRSSRLKDKDKDYHYKHGEIATSMLNLSYEILKEKGYKPYYLYRQKHMAGAGENVGFCLAGHEGIYNARIMDEHQSILAFGAGGISKVYFPEEDRLERVPNVSNYSIYIDRIDEMIERKKKNFFEEETDVN